MAPNFIFKDINFSIQEESEIILVESAKQREWRCYEFGVTPLLALAWFEWVYKMFGVGQKNWRVSTF